jgi:ferredoxin-NADP reductase
MADFFFIAGVVILAAAAAQAVFGVVSVASRAQLAHRRSAEELSSYRERARILLERTARERERVENSWNGKRKFRIARRVYENPAKDICSFYLVPHDQRPLPPFRPGQFLTFELPIPGQAKPVVRCYSLSEGPHVRDSYRVTIKKLPPPPKAPPGTPPGLSSSFFHDALAEGAIVEVMAPAGEFYLDEASNRPVVLIAGGVGLTPVLAMLNTLVASGSNREIWFFYGVRHQGEHAMFEHLKRVDAENPNVRIVVCYSDPTESCREGEHYTRKGFVSVELMKSVLPSNNYEFYICGPPPMMQMITKDLQGWGVPDADIRFEAFGPASVPKPPAPPPGAEPAQGFAIEFARSKKTVQWAPGAGTLLELGEANGIVMNSGCRAGNCGTCLTAIKAGDVVYQNRPGRTPEAGSCLVCIATPKGAMVLDA